ncbi:GTP-binding protein HflX [Coriobacterium glomerans PW2]|uniref:GTPase HflX n=1 Tax=Coriobacterium glomerans (strain ATCC 49209 / DSM 20642 / JCM 10262 / PW2) TaxID=700015 RepID=F2N7X3_CORGP|nr:GTPase HflX [Coriobacterium glomerans]AEB07082.1 GTP-binding protein HflX [Coriobacterium glomerans PW2]
MTHFRPVSTELIPERALLVGVDLHDGGWPTESSLDELARLVESAGANPVGRMVQRMARPNPRSMIGSGKLEELKSTVSRLDVDVVIFDEDLTPSQQNNIERAIGASVKIIDRTALILDIFGMRAQTREGSIQVQLAQLEYLLPRLRGMWTHLAKEQTRGGIGSRFGQGESQLEVDRRLIRKRISALKRSLLQIETRRDVQSRARRESPAFRIALAGYTNAGKSTLMNRLTGSDIMSADKLFATLDPTTRAFKLPGGRLCTLTDTVGFIQKLPHGLVDAFKSTLAEARDSDIILEVVDASDENYLRQMSAVDVVLDEIGASEQRRVTVLNKIDLIDPLDRADLERRHPDAELVSSVNGLGIERLLERLSCEASTLDSVISLRIPYREAALISLVHEQGHVLQEVFDEDAVRLVADIPPRVAERLIRYRDASTDQLSEPEMEKKQ